MYDIILFFIIAISVSLMFYSGESIGYKNGLKKGYEMYRKSRK